MIKRKSYSKIISSIFTLGALHERSENTHLTKKHLFGWLSGSSELPSMNNVNVDAGA